MRRSLPTPVRRSSRGRTERPAGQSPPTCCRAPFTSLHLDQHGDVRACCMNESFPLGNVTDRALVEIWHGERARRLRRALEADDLSLGCDFCAPQMQEGRADLAYARWFEGFPVEGPDPAWPRQLELALTNTCNLRCVMCNGEWSSSIRALVERRPPLPQAYDEAFFDGLRPFLPHLERVKFYGGEPFLAAENHRIWERLGELGGTTRCAVVTNATRFDARVEAVLDALAFDVTVSLDGVTAATVESLRRNLDFGEAVEHARRFREHTRRAGTAFGFNFCLTPANWHELGPFLAFADDWDADVRVIAVSEPGHCLHDLDEGALAEVLASWEAESARWEAVLGRNRRAWSVEVEQLRRTLAERRNGVAPTLRQPVPVTGPLVEPPLGPAAVAGGAPAVARLVRWAAGGPVATLDLGPDGRVRSVRVDGGQGRIAGLDPALAPGRPLDEVLRGLDAGAGRAFHLLEHDAEPGVVDRILSATTGPPRRGATGSVVRVVAVRAPDGGVAVHVATDRSYDRDAGDRDVAVAVRRGG
ncbi:MAG: radical SAM protein [Acidimicrobiales bacterium]|nr:radical SAM protein [Acidimicrobiales bacterium]